MMEDKNCSGGTLAVNRVIGGSKVSQIARTFQSFTPPHAGSNGDILSVGGGRCKREQSTSPKSERRESIFKEPKSLAESPTIVTVVRTESHVARFNNARALFEKLGEENRSKGSDRNKSSKQDVRSRSSSTNSSLGDEPPNRTAQKTVSCSSIPTMLNSRSPSPSPHTNSQSASFNGVPNGFGAQMNGNHEATENCKPLADEPILTPTSNSQLLSSRTSHFVNGSTEKPSKPDKPERKLNSRELIEKQRNWTSHFSKTRNSTSRSNSDPSKLDVKATPALKNTPDNSAAATRSSSFTSPRLRSPPPSSPPPPPPNVSKSSPVKSPRTNIQSTKVSTPSLPKPVDKDPVEDFSTIQNHSTSNLKTDSVNIPTKDEESILRHSLIGENENQTEEEDSPKSPVDYTQTLRRSKKMVSSVRVTLDSPQIPALVNSQTQGSSAPSASPTKEVLPLVGKLEDDRQHEPSFITNPVLECVEAKDNLVLSNETNCVQTNNFIHNADIESKVKANSYNVDENLAGNLENSLLNDDQTLSSQLEQTTESECVSNKPNVQFNIGSDLNSELLKSTTTMCSSSVSEEDSGFVSSEAANLGASFITDSDTKELDQKLLNLNDTSIQFLDDDGSSSSSDNPQQKYEHDDIVEALAQEGETEEEIIKAIEQADLEKVSSSVLETSCATVDTSRLSVDTNRTAPLDTSLMTPDEADNLLSTRLTGIEY